MGQCNSQIFQKPERSITTMTLKFFGRGSGFADEHTSAYFITANKEMVIIDLPDITRRKLKSFDLTSYEKLYILITHTHGDHVGGLGLFVQYAYFTLKKPVVIVAPSKEVADDITVLLEIEGNDPSWYKLITITDIQENEWFGTCIPVMHSPQLKNKCFGYHLIVDNTSVVYTGDTSTLDPFLPFLTDNCELYVDTSVDYGIIHLKLDDSLEDFISLTKKGIKVYLMHLDDVEAAKKIIADLQNIEVITLV